MSDSLLAELEAHRDLCPTCTCKPWTVCAVAAKLLERMTADLAKRMAPAPVKPSEA